MSNHTPEPWKLVPEQWSTQILSGGAHVLEIISSESTELELANGERIVSCVNACAGFTNEELETLGHFKAMHETITAENERLRAELDRFKNELLYRVVTDACSGPNRIKKGIVTSNDCAEFVNNWINENL